MLDVVEELLQQGVELHKSGKVEVACQLYTAVLKAHPEHPTANHNMGVLAVDVGKVQEALPFFEAALEANADTAQFWLSYIDALINVERIADAQAVFDQAKNNGAKGDGFDQLEWRLNVPDEELLGTNTAASEAYQNQPNILETLKLDQALRLAKKMANEGCLGDAKRTYQDILVKFPKNKRAIDGLKGLAGGPVGKASKVQEPPENQQQSIINLYSQGQLQRALEQVEILLQQFPSSSFLYNISGAVYKELGQLDACVEAYSKALAIKPDDAEVYSNMGNALQDQGKLDEAIEAYNKALAIKPDYADAYYNMGNALQEQGKLEEAIEAYNKSLSIQPDNAEAYSNMGATLQEQGKLKYSIEAFSNALTLQPDNAEAYNNMGLTLKDQGKLEEAIAAFNKALAIQPDYEAARGQKLHQLAHICDWDAIGKDSTLIPSLGTSEKFVPPFVMLSLEDAPDSHRIRSEVYAKAMYPQRPLPLPALPSKKPKRIRIGYFSADFHNHATMYLMAKVFAAHDRQKFEVYAYSYGPDANDQMRQVLIKSVDVFEDVREMGFKDTALRSRQDKIDIAVDLKGHTQDQRLGIFAYRPAPTQISYLGYPGTIGAEFIDYIVADPVVVPSNRRRAYSEEIIYLPHTYQPNDDKRVISQKVTTKADMGLPEDGFVFCCFNSNYKISPAEFDIWMRLLGKVNGSVLWLLKSNRWAEQNLQREAEKRGIQANRLVFAEKLPHDQHLGRQKHADLFIDTFNVNAHTTASDALWAGLPIVTKLGQGFAARVAGSLLTAVGLTELITENEQDYEALILELATNPVKLANVREKLAVNRLSQPLFDTQQYTKHLEDAYQQAYQNYFEGKSPQTIVVPS
jgi:protein O-GlcNAc transferase